MLITKKTRCTQNLKILEQNAVLLELKMEIREIKSDKPWMIWTYAFLSNLEYLMILKVIYILLDKSWPAAFILQYTNIIIPYTLNFTTFFTVEPQDLYKVILNRKMYRI